MDYKVIKKEMYKLGRKIKVPKKYYPLMQFGDGSESVFIEIAFNAYYYVVTERGEELLRKRFTNIDELMFKVFYDITSEMSADYEVKHRISGQSPRRVMFK